MNFSELCGFTDKQWQATETADRHRYTLFGGSRGPGKSYWLRWYLLRLLLMWGGQGHDGVQVMLACEDYPSLTGRQIGKIAAEFPPWLGEIKSSKTNGLGYHLRPEYGGGVIALRNLDDPSRYQSFEFAAIGIDELTKNVERTFHILRGSLRWPGISRTGFVAATNPEANWVRDYWIEKRVPPELEKLLPDFAFVPALPTDNPHLSESYWDELNALPGALRQAWLHGDWYAAVEGLVYDNFSAANLAAADEAPDPSAPIELAIDDGYIDPRATLFIQRTGQGIYIFDELYQTKTLEEDTIADILDKCRTAEWAQGRAGQFVIPQLAAVSHEAVALRERLRTAGIAARNWLENKKGASRGTSVRVEAIKLTRSLVCDGNEYRTIKIHPRCKHLLDEITMGYRYKEGKHGLDEQPEDGNDHACQAMESWCWLRLTAPSFEIGFF